MFRYLRVNVLAWVFRRRLTDVNSCLRKAVEEPVNL